MARSVNVHPGKKFHHAVGNLDLSAKQPMFTWRFGENLFATFISTICDYSKRAIRFSIGFQTDFWGLTWGISGAALFLPADRLWRV